MFQVRASNEFKYKQALSLVKNEHVFSPKTVIKQVKVGGMNSPQQIAGMIVKSQVVIVCGTDTRPKLVWQV